MAKSAYFETRFVRKYQFALFKQSIQTETHAHRRHNTLNESDSVNQQNVKMKEKYE